ncbi:hypothetical protein BGM19_26715 [Streptomyces agglomeratus]|uniref:hypothetical protein n=1 Tax=Streptomyces agglomeratus TaxID=285458 RepID=UPI00086C2A29|nr:hypothetical protein [Streptomyces agglomeratus]OEJ61069.1 hypothetical protein BGM19_26715 [Streptomyces agglomeratus]
MKTLTIDLDVLVAVARWKGIELDAFGFNWSDPLLNALGELYQLETKVADLLAKEESRKS